MLTFPMNFSWFYAENQNKSLKNLLMQNKGTSQLYALFLPRGWNLLVSDSSQTQELYLQWIALTLAQENVYFCIIWSADISPAQEQIFSDAGIHNAKCNPVQI